MDQPDNIIVQTSGFGNRVILSDTWRGLLPFYILRDERKNAKRFLCSNPFMLAELWRR
jgi:hypothetical protein